MSDIHAFIIWYLVIEALGLMAWPLTRRIFKRFSDQGWGFSKITGIVFVSYIVWVLGSLKLVPFERLSASLVAVVVGLIAWAVEVGVKRNASRSREVQVIPQRPDWRLVIFEEVIFLAALGFWAWVRAHNPDIRGLEKFMDYGFVKSILRGKYFPPLDQFLSGYTINYYYFGHVIAAVLTKLSGVNPAVAFNLQIATLFALTALGSFVIGLALCFLAKIRLPSWSAGKGEGRAKGAQGSKSEEKVHWGWSVVCGLLTLAFVAWVGNLHWLREYLAGRINDYWYASASRVIPYTINEFPIYSFVVADLHAHVSDLPVVLLFIGVLISLVVVFVREEQQFNGDQKYNRALLIFLSFLLGTMYVTNSWDFVIYLGFLGLVLGYFYYRQKTNLVRVLWDLVLPLGGVVFLSIVFFLPYWLTVKLISQGVGIVHTRSPLNLILILWGFYFFLSVVYLVWVFRRELKKFLRAETAVASLAYLLGVKIKLVPQREILREKVTFMGVSRILSLMFLIWAFVLLIAPEVVYVKDIYRPDYYRANTMFKFYYQAWVLFALATAYGTICVIRWLFEQKRVLLKIFLLSTYLFLFLSVGAYPYVAIRSNFKGGRESLTLDGNQFLYKAFPDDAQAIAWLNANVPGQPVIVEAVGESYSDYARISANTGLPAVLGWPVHEWLWRGGWDIPGSRQEEVRQIYESQSEAKTKELLEKYKVEYLVVGGMERESYAQLQVAKFDNLGEVVYENGAVKIYKLP